MSDERAQREIRQAARRAVSEARDRDDMDGYETALEALAALRPGATGSALQIMPPVFRLMYDGASKVLALYEKHDKRYFDIGTPDAFAAAALHTLQTRLDEGYFGPYPLPKGPSKPALVSYLDWLHATGQVPAMAGDTAVAAFEAWKDAPAFALVRAQADTLPLARVILNELEHPETVRLDLVGLLVTIIRRFDAAVARELRAPLMASRNPALQLLGDALEPTVHAEAAAILAQAKPGVLRQAGRDAFVFLQSRSPHQYEAVEVLHLETAVFRASSSPD